MENIFNRFLEWPSSHPILWKIILSAGVTLLYFLIKTLWRRWMEQKIVDASRRYYMRRLGDYLLILICTVWLLYIWIFDEQSTVRFAQFFGLIGAGLAVALHETISNIVGWIYIIWRKPFRVGERIEINGIIGDVIDVRIFEFSIIEVGGKRLTGGEQSTGRIIHIPNGMTLRHSIANFDTGFPYVWDEIAILVTFESNWKKAKQILEKILNDHVGGFAESADRAIQNATGRYLIYRGKTTPILYTSIADSGVQFSMRYMVPPKQIRSNRNKLYEAILEAFSRESDIDFAYPTIRYYDNLHEHKQQVQNHHETRSS
ncbi:MAG: mechanosensitive ion channel family protein [Lentisphaerae bacterium]|nr:MAG: mechanosensitive ion channel family protein [Lentisphaerota bacterium]